MASLRLACHTSAGLAGRVVTVNSAGLTLELHGHETRDPEG